jgi:hypothetical protein
MKTLLVTVAVLLVPAAAHADQCQLLDVQITERVSKLVDTRARFATLCEPCGETVPGVPFVPTAIDVSDQLLLDGRGHDLAYTYMQTGPTKFENLAMLVGCPVNGVSPSLRVEEETPDGVMITADSSPVRRYVEPEPEPALEVAAAPPSPPPLPTYYSTTIIYAVPWVAIAAVAGGAGFLLGVIATLLAVGLRRRRAMTPRAAQMKL